MPDRMFGGYEALSPPDEPDYVIEGLTELLPAARTQGHREERSQDA